MPPKKRGRGAANNDSKSNIQTRKPYPSTTSPPPALQSTSSAPARTEGSIAQSLSGGPSANKGLEKVLSPCPTAGQKAAIGPAITEEKILAPAGSTAGSHALGSQSESAAGGSELTGGMSNFKKKVVKKVVRKVKKPCLIAGTQPAPVPVDANSYLKTDIEGMNPTIAETTIADSEPSVQTAAVEAVLKETQVVPIQVLNSTGESMASGPEMNTENSSEVVSSDVTKRNVKKVIRKVIKKKIVKKMVPKGTLAAKKAAEAALALSLVEEQTKAGDAGTNKAEEEIEKTIVHDVKPSDNVRRTKEEIEFKIGENNRDKSQKSTTSEINSRVIPTPEPGNKKDAEVNKEMIFKIAEDKESNIEISTDSVDKKESIGEFNKSAGEIQKQKADCSTSNSERKVRKVIKKKIIKKLVPKGTLLAKRSTEENLNVSANLEAGNRNAKSEETLILTDRPLHKDASSNSGTKPEQAQAKELMVSTKESPEHTNRKHSSNTEIQKGIEIEGSREKIQKTTLPVKQLAKETVTQSEKSEAEYSGSNKEEKKPQQRSTITMADKMPQTDFGRNAGSEEMDGLTERQKRRKTEIFIGGLDKEVREMDIRSIFEKAGEISEVRMFMENNTGKNKGYCFLRYKEPAQAKKAISMFSKVEIRGKRCGASPVEDHDSIFLGNIDKRWKKDEIIRMLKDFGIEKIDSVTVMQDPQNPELNRGFAFLDLETNRDAQIAYKKLKAGDFSKGGHVRIDWAEPWHEPNEEEMLQVKSVFVEFIPSSWDKAKMSEIFEKFGKIERVVLARDIPSSKRKDYAFVNYTTREAAISCINFVEKEELVENGSKVNIKVSLAKPVSKGKMMKGGGRTSANEKEKHKMLQSNKSSNANSRGVLREPPRQEIGNPKGKAFETIKHGLHGEKRGPSALSDGPVYSDMRGLPRPRYDSSYHGLHSSSSSSYGGTQPYGIQDSSLFYQNPNFGYSRGSYHGKQSYYPDSSETRETVAPPHGHVHRSWPYPPRCKNSDMLFGYIT